MTQTQGQPTQEQMILRPSAGGSLDENMKCGAPSGRVWLVLLSSECWRDEPGKCKYEILMMGYE